MSRLRGDGPGPRIKHQDMQVKPNDDPMVKACFNIAKFNSEAWLGSLTAENTQKYLTAIETQRTIPKQVNATVKFIIEYQTLEDPYLMVWAYNLHGSCC
jgi:hypothetical protein